MAGLQEILIAFAIAGALTSLYAILRAYLGVRSDQLSQSDAQTNLNVKDFGTCMLALAITLGVAASLFYTGFALAAVLPATAAFFGTFALHIGLVALFNKLIPISQPQDKVISQGSRNAGMATSAA